MRIIAGELFWRDPCAGCGDSEQHWDRVAGEPWCPNCIEALALGEADPRILQVEPRRCDVCYHFGTVSFRTFPMHSSRPIELDLCGEHLRALIGRRLGVHAFVQLRRRLADFDIGPARVFLLHHAFYDSNGLALQPTFDVEA